MRASRLRELFGPRVHIKVIDRVPSGSPVRLCFAISRPENPNTPGAALLLARRHFPMTHGHRLMTQLCEGETDIVAEIPVVEDLDALLAELAECGISARRAEPPAEVDVAAVRAALGLSQEAFALQYGLDVATLRNWEQSRTSPDRTARSYLSLIAHDPAAMRRLVKEAQEKAWDAARKSA